MFQLLKQSRSVLAAVGMCAFASMAQAETVTFATWQPEASENLHATSLHWFIDEVNKRSDGKLKVNMFWGSAIASITEIPAAVENGVVDMGDLVIPYFPDQFPLNNVISFFWPQPNSPRELGDLMAELHEKYPQFSEELSKYNLKLIGLRPLGYYGITCRETIKSLDDFKGKRIRAYGLALPAVIEALGAVPVSMSTPETYEALQRGILDCTPIEPILSHGWKYDEVAPYFVDVPLGASWGQFIVVNKNKFDALPEVLQKVLTEVGNDYLAYFTDHQVEQTKEVRDLWDKNDKYHIVKVDSEKFLRITENSDEVKGVRKQWIAKAKEAGLPADEIAARLAFK
jgi:TRAP-type C4-dicarboxylate transport system substrate-binding protein